VSLAAETADFRELPERDVVFMFAFETWSNRERFRPPDRLLHTLANHSAVRGLLVANPFQSWPVRTARRLARRDGEVPLDLGRDRVGLVSPYRLRRRNPTNVAWAKRSYLGYDRAVRRVAEHLGLVRPVVITCHPMQAAFAPLEWAHSVTYYALDDHAAHPADRKYERAFEEAYRIMRERGTRVAAVSAPLLDKLAPTGPSAIVPNAIDPDEWRRPGPPPAWFEQLPRPRIVYTGVLLGDRFDWAVVRALAERYRDGSVVLAGALHSRSEADPIRDLPNVHVVAHLDRADVVGVVTASDVCVIPHLDTRLTTSMSPLKLFEYLAGGRPVVASDLPGIDGVHPSVRLAATPAHFVDQVGRALEAGPMAEPERQAFIAANSWVRRHEQIMTIAFA
jgi:glycosyltransferase involved in cell wall biosynthesis